jgi:RNA polymerase sigma-70 factor, ECF subfamily
MSTPGSSSEFSRALADWKAGNRELEPRLFSLLYDELHRLAAHYLRLERPDHTLQATALVHEAFIRLIGQGSDWQDRSHFFAAAAQSMRRILVDYARAHHARKRGGDHQKVALEEPLLVSHEQSGMMMALDEALDRLSRLDTRQSKIVELRYFGGFTTAEIALLLGISEKTVERDWEVARAWLHSEISK